MQISKLGIMKSTQLFDLTKYDVTGYSPALITFPRHVTDFEYYHGEICNNEKNVEISDKAHLLNDILALESFRHY